MRKSFLSVVVLSSVLLVGIGVTLTVRLVYQSSSTANQTVAHNTDVSAFTVLQAHVGRNDKAWSRFTQKATLIYHVDTLAGSASVFERKLRLSVDGALVRYDKATLNKNQSYLFDGNIVVRTTFDTETTLETKVIDGVEADSIKFQLATCGLLPVLRRLAEPSTQVDYVGTAANGNRFQVKTAGGSWYFYANSDHLVERLEVNNLKITYEDYRTVGGVKLPFYQQVKKGDKLLYEIKFETVELNPVFAVDSFKTNLLDARFR